MLFNCCLRDGTNKIGHGKEGVEIPQNLPYLINEWLLSLFFYCAAGEVYLCFNYIVIYSNYNQCSVFFLHDFDDHDDDGLHDL